MEFWALVSLLLLLCISSSLSARIAGFHAVGGSQYINIRNTLEELVSRGHEVKKYIYIPIVIVSLYIC